ncbi:MAG: hypothetical protein A2762_04920 [Candidatus Lloydbacteria bacterium RIFCSPHIGHO2_01_FULL_54_11]|nr:MAG: hypothetical protein A2762_04920 [Candidatus Lloydbacteria bacterium RIFCSPHIGHO2_01_FULL_54_11]
MVLGLTLSPYLFADMTVSPINDELEAVPGKLFPIFALWLFSTMALSVYKVISTFRKSVGLERQQWKYLLIGSFATYLSLVLFNFIFAGILHNTTFLKYTPLYSLPIVIATAYAIIKHNLFDLKLLATEAFVSIIAVVYFAKITIAVSVIDRVIDGLIFLATAYFGLQLIRSAKEEVARREEIRALAKKLAETNYELARSNEQLKILDKRKSEFVSLVSHQLRAPITAIKGYASLLMEGFYGKLSVKTKEPAERIFLSSQRLVKMVADFLDLSKIEQDAMSYNMTSVDIGEVLRDVATDFVFVAKEKDLTLEINVPAKQKFVVSADDGKLRQIISNVIDNSIKYTPKGSIAVSVGRDTAKKTVAVRIKDTGIGLSPDDKEHIFGKFTRGKGGQKENTGGSGLGLYVAKKMLEAQKGNLSVESDGVGLGSTFVIEFPAEGT